jgi:serine/threonine-protein kinase RsbW
LNSTAKASDMIRMLDEQTLEVNLPNKVGFERIAMDCSASLARIVGFVQERIDDLKTAVSEACLNAMEHGNQWRPDARVIVTMKFDDHTFSVSVMDEGQGIIKFPEEPDIDKKIEELQSPRGIGMFLIRELVDQVEFNRVTPQGHILRMVIKMEY